MAMNKKLRIFDLVCGLIAFADIGRNFVLIWREIGNSGASMTVILITASVNAVTRSIADCISVPGFILIGTAIVVFSAITGEKKQKSK